MIIPAKTLDSAKSRLPLPDGERRALALRLAASTIRVALQTSGVGLVLVVNSDSQIARTSQTAGATVVDESRPRGLNAAVRLGQREDVDRPVPWPLSLLTFLAFEQLIWKRRWRSTGAWAGQWPSLIRTALARRCSFRGRRTTCFHSSGRTPRMLIRGVAFT